MYKHIKMRAELLEGGEHARITIETQTHRWLEFGIAGVVQGYSHVFRYGDVDLISGPRAGNIVYGGFNDTTKTYDFFLMSAASDANILMIPAELWPKLKAAVEAYNLHFKE